MRASLFSLSLLQLWLLYSRHISWIRALCMEFPWAPPRMLLSHFTDGADSFGHGKPFCIYRSQGCCLRESCLMEYLFGRPKLTNEPVQSSSKDEGNLILKIRINPSVFICLEEAFSRTCIPTDSPRLYTNGSVTSWQTHWPGASKMLSATCFSSTLNYFRRSELR